MYKAKVIRDYDRVYENPIRLKENERVIPGKRDDEYPGWQWCTNSQGISGWVPEVILQRQNGEVFATCGYDAIELTVKFGEELLVEAEQNGWLWCQSQSGERGWIPTKNVINKDILILESQRLFVRPWILDDAENFLRLTQDDGFNLFSITRYRQPDVASAKKWILEAIKIHNETRMGLLGIYTKEKDELIGFCGLRPVSLEGEPSPRIEMTYRLKQSSWGRGYGSEASILLLGYGFTNLCLPEIITVIAVENERSKKLAMKIGMKFERNLTHLGIAVSLLSLKRETL